MLAQFWIFLVIQKVKEFILQTTAIFMKQCYYSIVFLFIIIVRMKVTQRQDFSIKCQCIIMKNDTQINGKKKSKFSLISFNPQSKHLIVQPFGAQKQQENLKFPLSKLKAIHKKYIEQGKLTLQFLQKSQKLKLKGINVSNTQQLIQISSQILISSASKENLNLLISKIVALKNTEIKNTQPPKNTQLSNSTKQNAKRKPAQLSEPKEQQIKMSRKQLMKSVYMPQKSSKSIRNTASKPKIHFFDLPQGIIDTIFQYCKLTLQMRVINQRFSNYVLKNISYIRLKDDVDEVNFNRLSKWAIQVQCRMKNVKNIELMDKYQQQQLVKDKAKTLKFGNWKEISSKNILQLKGLRIYSLEIPYSIKFDLSNLFGLRLVQLRFKSPQLTNIRSQFIKSQDLAYILKNIRDLKVLQIPFATTQFLTMIQFPKRITELRIYYLNENTKQDSTWRDFERFQNLKKLSIWHLEKLGVRKQNHEAILTIPESLTELQIGSFFSIQNLEKLPLSLTYLKLIGENYLNNHIQNIYLPNLKILDLTMSRNIRQQVLQIIQNLSLITHWDRNTIDFVSNYARSKHIALTTTNPNFH